MCLQQLSDVLLTDVANFPRSYKSPLHRPNFSGLSTLDTQQPFSSRGLLRCTDCDGSLLTRRRLDIVITDVQVCWGGLPVAHIQTPGFKWDTAESQIDGGPLGDLHSPVLAAENHMGYLRTTQHKMPYARTTEAYLCYPKLFVQVPLCNKQDNVALSRSKIQVAFGLNCITNLETSFQILSAFKLNFK